MMHYIYRDKENKNNIIIDRPPNKQVILLAQKNGKTLPILKCSETKLSYLFSNPRRSFERISSKVDWDNTSRIIRYVLEGEEDSKKWFKPSSMMQTEMHVIPNREWTEIAIEFRVFYQLYKKVYGYIAPEDKWNNKDWNYVDIKDGEKYQYKDDELTKHWHYRSMKTEELVFTYYMSAHDYMNALAFVNIYYSPLAMQLLKNAYPYYPFTNLYPLGPKRPLPWEGPGEDEEPPLDVIDPDDPPIDPDDPNKPGEGDGDPDNPPVDPDDPNNPGTGDGDGCNCCCCKYKKAFDAVMGENNK